MSKLLDTRYAGKFTGTEGCLPDLWWEIIDKNGRCHILS